MELIDEANRCLKCRVAQCSKACPVATPVPEVMKLFLDDKIGEAGALLFENNPLSAVTSIVCPHESNCFGHCVLGRKGAPVEFYRIEQYISQFYLETAHLEPPASNGIMVGVIGAGPAGIVASIRLALRGFDVTLIEANDRVGGVLRYGIPDFRLPKEIVDRYAVLLHDLGVRFKPNTFVGSTATVEDMFLDGYKAIFVAVGTAKPVKLGLLGETLGNVHYAIDYLRSPESYHLGRNVVVIGAGNVALDAARMARRHEPLATVTLVNNRAECDMTGNVHDVEMARVDGVRFVHQLSAVRLTTSSVVCVPVDMTENEDGTRTYEERMSEHVEVPADTIIMAIGQRPQGTAVAGSAVTRTSRGLFEADQNGRTADPRIFAAGDVVTGPRTVVEAAAFAKKVADEIERFCLGEGAQE